ncbi:MAG: hypothetical protein IJ593_01255 [Lachnospiraceae bacterium]|nr:hypothetical protein [Lachnospiraceae bacterium]
MSFLLLLFVLATVYVASFSNDFTKENIDSLLPFITVFGVVVLILLIFVG